MKQLIWKLVLPLTIILFVVFTKWWYVDVVDGPDEILTGFPVPYLCSGWHTSMSLQIFVAALVIDFITYFTFVFILIYVIHRYVVKIEMHKFLVVILFCISGLFTAGMILIGMNPDNRYMYKRDFEFIELETGYKFIWENQTQPDFYKYHPELKKD